MPTSKEEKTQELFAGREVEVFRVLYGLHLHLDKSKIYRPYEQVELTKEQYELHRHRVETEEQYQSQFKLDNRNKKKRNK